jgi:hypothetical protein
MLLTILFALQLILFALQLLFWVSALIALPIFAGIFFGKAVGIGIGIAYGLLGLLILIEWEGEND